MGSGYYSSFTLQPIASRNQNCAGLTVQDTTNVVQYGRQLMLQRSLLCQGVTNL